MNFLVKGCKGIYTGFTEFGQAERVWFIKTQVFFTKLTKYCIETNVHTNHVFNCEFD